VRDVILITIALLCQAGRSEGAGIKPAEYARGHKITALTIVDRDSTKLEPRDQTNNLKPEEKIVSLTGKGLSSIDGIAGLRVEDGGRDVPLAAIDKLHLLQGKYFTANNIGAIPPEIFTMKRLRKLQVSKNHLTELPAAIGNLTELIHFNIAANQIAALPDSIERLTKLRVCDFSDNRITRLPEGFGKVRVVHQLRIRNNPISALPEGFAGMPGSIDITGTKIRMESLSPGLRAQIGTEKCR
jgi:Leucine-rich repeat (LRR) protein